MNFIGGEEFYKGFRILPIHQVGVYSQFPRIVGYNAYGLRGDHLTGRTKDEIRKHINQFLQEKKERYATQNISVHRTDVWIAGSDSSV